VLLLVFDFGTVHEILVLAVMSYHKVFANKYDLTQKLRSPLDKVSGVTELFESRQRTASSSRQTISMVLAGIQTK